MLVGKFTRNTDVRILQRAVDRYEDVTIDPNSIHIVESRYLDVPLEEEEAAIRAGANYDADIRCFVVPENLDLQAFKRWFPKVEADLIPPKDTKNYLTRSGKPLESYRLPQDSSTGVTSLAMPLMYAALPAIAALAFFGFQITGSLFLSIPLLFLSAPYLLTIYQRSWNGQVEMMKSALLLLLLPFSVAASSAMGNSASLSMIGFLSTACLAWVFVSVLPFFFGKQNDMAFLRVRRLWMAVSVSVLITLTAVVSASAFAISGFLGSVLASFIFGLTSLYALYYCKQQSNVRAVNLANFSNDNSMSRLGSEREAFQIQKARQAKASVEDQSLRIQIGQSKGIVSRKGYANSPAPGVGINFSINDAGRGAVTMGPTGSGKTVVINNITYCVLANNIAYDLTHQEKPNSQNNGGEQ
ncbi:DUF5710 domain-containing protein [Stenotrophomonas maltophilia]|uniref:DUF5710 domain-containing protein n=1 Tax=Stenotrophomonas maltophilia TaxID=40324 RepID=UPI0012B137E5|nr:DUF5710 domain-containing protein [Stenotrophomonas maltophilia]QGL66993.1 hypothetical protein FEO86_06715 [Stenotrophomonas maltophilia]